MLTKARLAVAASVMALTTLLGGAGAARADYYVTVPQTVYVVKYDCCGKAYTVPYTVYVRVLDHTGCGY
jgi:hypothetical protein